MFSLGVFSYIKNIRKNPIRISPNPIFMFRELGFVRSVFKIDEEFWVKGFIIRIIPAIKRIIPIMFDLIYANFIVFFVFFIILSLSISAIICWCFSSISFFKIFFLSSIFFFVIICLDYINCYILLVFLIFLVIILLFLFFILKQTFKYVNNI